VGRLPIKHERLEPQQKVNTNLYDSNENIEDQVKEIVIYLVCH